MICYEQKVVRDTGADFDWSSMLADITPHDVRKGAEWSDTTATNRQCTTIMIGH